MPLPFTVVGDIHGRLDTLHHAAVATLRAGLTTMIQVGDFWAYEPRDLTKADRMLGRLATQFNRDPAELHLYFCDGNHENFDILNPNGTEPVQLGNHFTYMPRGLATDIEGIRVGFLGGAESIDRDLRLPGRDWWPEERITTTQIHRAFAMGPVDILITHDTTHAMYDTLYPTERDRTFHHVGLPERDAITELRQHLNPTWLIHGHHHKWNETTEGGTRVVALAADGRDGAVALLNPDLRQAEPLPERF